MAVEPINSGETSKVGALQFLSAEFAHCRISRKICEGLCAGNLTVQLAVTPPRSKLDSGGEGSHEGSQ